MNKRETSKSVFMQLILCTLIFFAVYLIGLNNYLLYHTLAEMFGIVVSIAIFIIAWNTRQHLDNSAFLMIGIAYLFIGGIDLLHLLAYKGMGVFKTHDGNLPTQLWISARLLQSISFLLAPFLIHRKVPAKAILFGYAGLTMVLIASVFYWKVFPVCFIEGAGLTPFKRVTEYAICLMLALSVGMFFKNRKAFDETVLWYIVVSVCLTILSEMSLTLYSTPYSFFSFIGHYFKIISFYLIYKAIIETGLRRPYGVLFRNLKKNELECRRERDKAGLYQSDLLWELEVNSALSELYIPLISHEISMQEIGAKILEKGKKITHSENGYISILDPDTGADTRRTLVMMTQCTPDGKNKTIHFSKGDDGLYPGLWGYSLNTLKPFFTNSPAKHPSYRGLPEGHPPIRNFLSIPVLFNEALVGQIALCNNQENFEEKDVEAVSRLAQYYALAINRWQITDSLRKAKDDLEIRVKERTKALSETNLILVNEIEERKILAENLLKSETELKDLSAKLIYSYEEERRRIGKEIHDGLAQTLSAIKVWSDAAMAQMEKSRPEESMEAIRSILFLSKASVEEVRHLMKNMRPTVLDDLGLEAAVSWLCQEFEKTHPHIVLKRKINFMDERIPESLKIVIFRITQEALNNVSKHSEAKSVSVLLSQCPDTIELTVHDNGIGFDMEDTANAMQPMEKGLGLASMEERARLSGGVFSIIASPAKGVMVRVLWKFSQEKAAANRPIV
ncbi:MAG: MASE3 domain-containing protein [Desulfosalsimonadaceae bacterium]